MQPGPLPYVWLRRETCEPPPSRSHRFPRPSRPTHRRSPAGSRRRALGHVFKPAKVTSSAHEARSTARRLASRRSLIEASEVSLDTDVASAARRPWSCSAPLPDGGSSGPRAKPSRSRCGTNPLLFFPCMNSTLSLSRRLAHRRAGPCQSLPAAGWRVFRRPPWRGRLGPAAEPGTEGKCAAGERPGTPLLPGANEEGLGSLAICARRKGTSQLAKVHTTRLCLRRPFLPLLVRNLPGSENPTGNVLLCHTVLRDSSPNTLGSC